MTVFSIFHHPHGPVVEFLVLFSVILVGPLVFQRFGLPGLVGLLVGGFLIGPHGLALIAAGNQTVPELGHLGLLYLMFVAGLELDLHMLKAYRRATVLLGLLAFAIPMGAGIGVGYALGWERPAAILLGALLSSHTLIVYPTIRDAGLAGNPAVATAVGATVLTDTLALVVLSLVAGTQTGSGSPAVLVAGILLGLAVLLVVGLAILPRVVDFAFRRVGGDRVVRYLVVIVSLLLMAALASLFGIEGIVGAFFAGLGLNRLVPNAGPSMERLEFFGSAVFIPIFIVSIGLLLDPSVMFTAHTLGLAGLIIAAALGGKALACWSSGRILGFDFLQQLAMYVLTIPQAAATLAVTVIGFEIGLFGTSVVNAVLVLILVSIVTSALLTDRVVTRRVPKAQAAHALGAHVLVVAAAGGPSDAAMRAATQISRVDGGHSDVIVTRADGEAIPDLRALDLRLVRHGFDGHIHVVVGTLAEAVADATATRRPSLLVVDDPSFEPDENGTPLLAVGGRTFGSAEEVAEVERRLARNGWRRGQR